MPSSSRIMNRTHRSLSDVTRFTIVSTSSFRNPSLVKMSRISLRSSRGIPRSRAAPALLALEEISLGLAGKVRADAHGKRAGHDGCNPGQQDQARLHERPRRAGDEADRRDQAVVHPEHDFADEPALRGVPVFGMEGREQMWRRGHRFTLPPRSSRRSSPSGWRCARETRVVADRFDAHPHVSQVARDRDLLDWISQLAVFDPEADRTAGIVAVTMLIPNPISSVTYNPRVTERTIASGVAMPGAR